MYNPNPQSRPYLSTGLSASIAHYRYQAKYFNGMIVPRVRWTCVMLHSLDYQKLGSPAERVSYSSCDLLRKRLAVPLFNDAKNRALVRIT